MKKSKLIKLAGSGKLLAAILDISPPAVSKWKEDGVPALRIYQLRELRPHWFETKKRVSRPA